MKFRVSYTKAQEKIIEALQEKRFVVVQKGRRVGLTRGIAQYFIEFCLQHNGSTLLWGDTIHQNIINYVERYFLPVLKQLPKEAWQWKKQEKKLIILNSVIDFRSADNPENWEGFGYDLVFLNEAGIILKDRYLWENAVRPMLLDNPNSKAIIGGVPKPDGIVFLELIEQAKNDDRFKLLRFSTFDNPFLKEADIWAMADDLGDSAVRQEIYGEVVEDSSSVLFSMGFLKECAKRDYRPLSSAPVVFGLDVGRGGDLSVIAKRKGNYIYEIVTNKSNDLMDVVDWVMAEMKIDNAQLLCMDNIGIGAGVFDMLNRLGVRVVGADMRKKVNDDKFATKRTEMYWKLKKMLENGKVVENKRLFLELSSIVVHYNNSEKMQVESKDKIKERLGRSPDYADACMISCWADPVSRDVDRRVKRRINSRGLNGFI